jgi:hypothetical protein
MPHPLLRDAALSTLATQQRSLIGAAAEVCVAPVEIVACLLALSRGGRRGRDDD